MPEYQNLCADVSNSVRLKDLIKQFNKKINSVHEDPVNFIDAFMLLGLINECLYDYFTEVRKK